MIKTVNSLHNKYPLCLSGVIKLEISRKIFEKYSNLKFHKTLSSRVVPRERTDRRDEANSHCSQLDDSAHKALLLAVAHTSQKPMFALHSLPVPPINVSLQNISQPHNLFTNVSLTVRENQEKMYEKSIASHFKSNIHAFTKAPRNTYS
jgi:hypothetical protein